MIYRGSPSDRTLLCSSSRLRIQAWGAAEGAVEVAGEVALDAAADLPVGLALGLAALDVGNGGRAAAHAADCHGVLGAVELPVAEPVETVPVGPSGGRRDRGGAREHGEACLGADPPGVRPGQQDLRGGERTEAVLGGDQARGQVLDDGGDLGLQLVGDLGQGDGPLASRIRVWCTTRVSRSALRGQGSCAQARARRSGGMWRSRSRSSTGAVTRTEARVVRAVLPDWTACPGRSSATAGPRGPRSAHLPGVRAGQQFPGRADRVDLVALPGAAPAHVPGGVDLGDLLALAGQVPGQAQPVMAGALDRPRHRPARGRPSRPLQ